MAYIGAGISRFNTADELTVTGDAQIDTTTLVVDSTNNRVGVGTASPTTALDVTGTVTADGLTVSPSSGAAVGAVEAIAGQSAYVSIRGNNTTFLTDSFDISQLSNGSAEVMQRANHPLIIGTNNAERLRVTSGGNVGIGTTSIPSDASLATSNDIKLEVGTSDTSRIYAKSTGTGVYNLGTSGGSAVVFHRLSDNSDEIGFETHHAGNNHAERMRLNYHGQLSLEGTGLAFDTTPSKNGLQLYYETDSGLATVGSYSGGGSTQLTFHTNSGGGASSERMRIVSNGSIGIGLDTPTMASTGVATHIHTNTASAAAALRLTNAATTSGTSDGLLVAMWNDNNAYFYNYHDSAVNIGTNNKIMLQMSAEGVLGIFNGRNSVGILSGKTGVALDDDASVNIFVNGSHAAGRGILCIYETSNGGGCVASAGYAGVSILHETTPSGDFVVGDTDGKMCIINSAHSLSFKNRLGATKTFRITWMGAGGT